MNFLLDMQISVQVAQALRSAGHDAFQLRERGLQRLADPEILRLAAAENRVVVTFDLDFTDLIVAGRLEKPSIIQYRTNDGVRHR